MEELILRKRNKLSKETCQVIKIFRDLYMSCSVPHIGYESIKTLLTLFALPFSVLLPRAGGQPLLSLANRKTDCVSL